MRQENKTSDPVPISRADLNPQTSRALFSEPQASSLWLLAPLLLIALFAADLWTPMMIAIPVCYMAALTMIVMAPASRDKVILSAVCTVLTVTDYLIALTRSERLGWLQVVTYCLAVAMMWIITGLELRHRSAQKELRDSEERYRTLYHGTPSMYFSVDRSGIVRSVNEFGAGQLGYRPGELIGGSFFDIFDEPDRAVAKARFEQAFDQPGIVSQWEFRKRHKDGSLLWVREWARLVNDDLGTALALIVCEDVTERKRTEDALRQSEQLATERLAQLKSVYASAPVALAFVDRNLRYVSINDALAAINGRAPEDHVGKTLREVLPALAEVVEPHYNQVIATGLPVVDVAVQGSTAAQPNERRYWLSSYYPVKDDSGYVLGVNVAVRDVTRRKQSEEDALFILDLNECIRLATESEELPWAVAVALGEYMAVDRCAFVEVDSGRDCFKVQRDYHRHAPSLVGSYPLSVFGAAIVGAGKAARNVAINDVHHDERTADCSASYHNMGVAAYIAAPLLRDGQWVSSLVVASAVTRDWTEREVTLVDAVAERTWLAVEKLRLNAALRQSEAQLRRLVAILEQTTDFVGTADTQTRTTYLNRAGRQMIGIGEETDVTGTMIADFHPPWAAKIVAETGIPQAIEHGVWRGETAFRGPEGKEIRVSQLILSHRDMAGRVEYLSTVARDITEQKQLEGALRDADRRKDEFIATLAHELRNPLTLIRNVVELLQRPGASDAETRRGHNIVERQAEYLTRLTDDLFDISRITREKIDLYKEPLELDEIIKAAIESSRPLIDAQGHELNVALSGAPIHVEGDRVRLTQIFMNLLNNAAKYTPRSGHIWLTLEQHDDSVVVSVRDDGAGIPEKSLPHLFDMFYQVDRSFSQVEGGLGLGLTLVRRLVEMHGGSVAAKSGGVNCGSEFTVRLPVLAKPCESAKPQALLQAKTSLTRIGRRILIADDFPEAATTLAKLLQESGNQVETAQDGIEAVETAARFRPDIAVLDIAMPRLNGYDTARRIREQPWGKNMILIAFTGWGQSRDRSRSKDAGFDIHLTKPIKYDAFLQLLNNLSEDRQET